MCITEKLANISVNGWHKQHTYSYLCLFRQWYDLYKPSVEEGRWNFNKKYVLY